MGCALDLVHYITYVFSLLHRRPGPGALRGYLLHVGPEARFAQALRSAQRHSSANHRTMRPRGAGGGGGGACSKEKCTVHNSPV
jgi:hypothetical protein